MSGGSYAYLCDADPTDVLGRMPRLRDMADRLDGLCPAAAEKTRAIMALYDELDQRIDELKGIWKAVEWRDSSDWSEEQPMEAVAKYVGTPVPGEDGG